MEYPFLCAFLAPLALDMAPPIGFQRFTDLLRLNLSKKDFAAFDKIRTYRDVLNVKLSLLNLTPDPYGLLDDEALKDALFAKVDLPQEVIEFLDKEPELAGRLEKFDELLSLFFRNREGERGFLGAYFTFERELRATLAAFRAKMRGEEIGNILRLEDPANPVIAFLIAHAKEEFFVFPPPFHRLGEAIKKHGENPIEAHQIETRFRFEWIAEEIQTKGFTFDWLLGYTLQLMILEEIDQIKKTAGQEIIAGILQVNA